MSLSTTDERNNVQEDCAQVLSSPASKVFYIVRSLTITEPGNNCYQGSVELLQLQRAKLCRWHDHLKTQATQTLRRNLCSIILMVKIENLVDHGVTKNCWTYGWR